MGEERELSLDEAIQYGLSFAARGAHVKARGIYQAILKAYPEDFRAMQALGVSCFETGLLHEAFYWFWRSRKKEPKHPLALMHYGLCLSQLGHGEEGLPDLERAVALAERVKSAELSSRAMAMLYNNLGNTYERLHRYKDALPVLDKGIAHDPDDAFPHYNRGICLLRLNRQREAIEALDRSLALRTMGDNRLNDADAYYNRGMAHLLLGNLRQGFADYEYRLQTSENVSPDFGLDAKFKLTRGDDVEGRTILVQCEQGLGDTIQMARFLPELFRRGAKEILIVAHGAMRPIFADTANFTVIEPGELLMQRDAEWTADHAQQAAKGAIAERPWRYDRWVALMSLPYVLGVEREEQIPAPWKFPVDPERVEQWAAEFPAASFRVGVCWAGNFQHKNDAHRSVPLSVFAKLFDASCSFVSVQQLRDEDKARFAAICDRHSNIVGLDLKDFRDTAAVLTNCDLVITADTSVAHLAGTLGIPTWILIPKQSTDWRWQLGRADSPWYPSVRLIRQERIGHWKSVVDAIGSQLGLGAAVLRAA